jgi:hypothetical protein
MLTPLRFSDLKKKQRAERDSWNHDIALRTHRALSWLDRAEREESDPDAAFIFLWIAFNAAYARDIDETGSQSERERYVQFIQVLVISDIHKRIAAILFDQFSDALPDLINNKYVLYEYWQHQANPEAGIDWESELLDSVRKAHGYVKHRDAVKYLRLVLSRLYVLRNQIMHGSATWRSETNRKQVQDAAQVMRMFVPIMIDVMMEDPTQDWGDPLYPVQH